MEEERCFTGEGEVAQPWRRGGSTLEERRLNVKEERRLNVKEERWLNGGGEVLHWRRKGGST
jgi:hypothetical protein